MGKKLKEDQEEEEGKKNKCGDKRPFRGRGSDDQPLDSKEDKN